MKHSSPRALARIMAGLACFLASWWGMGAAPSKPPSDYQVKAVFLYQFANFVEWPAKTFAKPDDPLVIGVVGDDPFGVILDETVRDVAVNQRKLVVRRFQRSDDLAQCQILFVSRSEKDRIPQILATVQDKSVLTVSETEKFASSGGIVNFILVEGRVKFEINPEAAERAGLRPSAKLLAVAKVVKSVK
jgi:hypothetical protein